jgi:hypothetical protein
MGGPDEAEVSIGVSAFKPKSLDLIERRHGFLVISRDQRLISYGYGLQGYMRALAR